VTKGKVTEKEKRTLSGKKLEENNWKKRYGRKTRQESVSDAGAATQLGYRPTQSLSHPKTGGKDVSNSGGESKKPEKKRKDTDSRN